MADSLPVNPRVHESTTSFGMNPVVQLNGASLRSTTFASQFAIGQNNIPYSYDGRGFSTDYEDGYGTLLSAGTFRRDTVSQSSNANGIVNFAPGVKDIYYNVFLSTELVNVVSFTLSTFADDYADSYA